MQIDQLSHTLCEATANAKKAADEGAPVAAREWSNAAAAAAMALERVQAAEKALAEREARVRDLA